ncbi:hypothetical protein QQZ08_005291 [Neonectria magnoliae]|uniref:DUF6604 domain-containing protein n=1 Tax=Neonectria magnoliae TaxID=2732573 RepID=A0ABR1I5E1_9HYPO
MAPHNIYVSYKRDTRYLVYWLLHVSNGIIKSSAALKDEPPQGLNTTGQITVSGLLSMSELIAQHGEPVPSVIYRLFQSIIQARTTVYGAFQQLLSSKSDPEVQRNNATHKHFIDTLTKSFNILGGEVWASDKNAQAQAHEQEEDVDQIILGNRFSALKIEEQGGESSDEDDGFKVTEQSSAPQKAVAKKTSARGKKGKKNKKAKKPKKGKAPSNVKEPSLDDVPFESIKIIESHGGLVTDYLMAVYSAVKEWADLRLYIQGMWKDVAYEGLNSAVAGAVSNVAITMVKQTGSTIFVDFPGHDSYETIINTITRGDPDKAQGNFHLSLRSLDSEGNISGTVVETDVDVKEQFLMYAYQDLVDFVTDFQATRSGKPTKAMNAKLANWDPKFNLQRATKKQRLDWRRSYTIMWLYDLVNVFSSIVVQRNTLKGERHAYETVDWSISGPWNQHRRLFGLVEFAGAITSMAMKKPGTNIQKMILPHHVFQLQCIVDSFGVSRGWFLSSLRGHILEAPANQFRPRRDVDLFLDRENQRFGHGFLQAVSILKQWFQKDGVESQRHMEVFELLEIMQEDFINWLGETKYMYGLNTIPPSRFSDHNANGLYEYSPFLCGTGLMEGLELAYSLCMALWDRMHEPMLLIHLHNMLVQRGFITEPVGLYATLQDLFKHTFFTKGQIPTSNFGEALKDRIGVTGSRFSQRQWQSARQTAANGLDIHGILDPNANRFFQKKSNLMVYRPADWNPDRIPDKDVAFGTFVFFSRLSQVKQVIDPVTKEPRPEDNILVREAKGNGLDDRAILSIREQFMKTLGGDRDAASVSPSVLNSFTREGYTTASGESLPNATGRKQDADGMNLTGRGLLEVIKLDISNDVCGTRPLSSLNYVWVTLDFLMLFTRIEERLKELKNPLYLTAYDRPGPWKTEKSRIALTDMALQLEDEECLRAMAEVFQNPRAGFMHHVYWEGLDDLSAKRPEQNKSSLDGVNDMCTVM